MNTFELNGGLDSWFGSLGSPKMNGIVTEGYPRIPNPPIQTINLPLVEMRYSSPYGNSHGWVLPAIKHHCAIDRLDASSIPCGCDVLLSNLLKGHHDWCCLRRIFAEYTVGSPATPGLEVCLSLSHSVKGRRRINNYYISHEILWVQDKDPHWSFLGRFRFKQAFQLSSHVLT